MPAYLCRRQVGGGGGVGGVGVARLRASLNNVTEGEERKLQKKREDRGLRGGGSGDGCDVDPPTRAPWVGSAPC